MRDDGEPKLAVVPDTWFTRLRADGPDNLDAGATRDGIATWDEGAHRSAAAERYARHAATLSSEAPGRERGVVGDRFRHARCCRAIAAIRCAAERCTAHRGMVEATRQPPPSWSRGVLASERGDMDGSTTADR